ncbi:hypothetical protein D3C78_1024360 [compost metagenome]
MKLLISMLMILFSAVCFGQETKNEDKISGLFENYTVTNSETITGQEVEILKELLSGSSKTYDFTGKKVAFVCGSTGSSIVDKKHFFESNKEYLFRNGKKISNIGFVEVNKKQWNTCYDVIVYYWVKIPGLIPTKSLKQRLNNDCKQTAAAL